MPNHLKKFLAKERTLEERKDLVSQLQNLLKFNEVSSQVEHKASQQQSNVQSAHFNMSGSEKRSLACSSSQPNVLHQYSINLPAKPVKVMHLNPAANLQYEQVTQYSKTNDNSVSPTPLRIRQLNNSQSSSILLSKSKSSAVGLSLRDGVKASEAADYIVDSASCSTPGSRNNFEDSVKKLTSRGNSSHDDDRVVSQDERPTQSLQQEHLIMINEEY